MQKRMTIGEIKQLLFNEQLTIEEIEALRNDDRKGVQKLLESYDRMLKQKIILQQQYEKKRHFDEQYNITKDNIIAGVDEAGRGPLAGPVVAAAVVLNRDVPFIGLDDSKQMTEAEREKLYHYIIENSLCYAVSIVDAAEIDRINIYEATKKAMKDAINHLSPQPNIALIDAVNITIPHIQTIPIVKGDAKSLAIAAASIIAKVTRDRMMKEIDEAYPMFEFAQNKGYGTKNHLDALKQYGPSPYHRKSFSPVKDVSS